MLICFQCQIFRREIWGKCEPRKQNFVCSVCFVLYIDVLSVSIRFSIRFCIYEHIQKYVLKRFPNKCFWKWRGCKTCFFSFKKEVAPRALGPISSCRASDTHGSQPGSKYCTTPKRPSHRGCKLTIEFRLQCRI